MGHGSTIDLSTENRTLGSLSGKLIGLGTVLAAFGLVGTLLLGMLEGAFDETSGPDHESAAVHGDPDPAATHSAVQEQRWNTSS